MKRLPQVPRKVGHVAEVEPAVAPGFEWRETPNGRVLVNAALERVAPHLFSTRDAPVSPGTLNPAYDAIAATFDVRARQIARVRQVHGRVVMFVPESPVDEDAIGDADALISTTPDVVVSVRVADCVPILVADRGGRAVAAIHAGWRGTTAGIATAAIEALAQLDIPPDRLMAVIGPSAGPCCYQVDRTVRDRFVNDRPRSEDWFVEDGDGHWRLDLWRANREQLEAAGVVPAHISTARACSVHDAARWHSHRRDGAAAGRMVAAIRLAPRR